MTRTEQARYFLDNPIVPLETLTTLCWMGDYDATRKYNVGEVVMFPDGTIHVCNGVKFEEFGSISDEKKDLEPITTELLPLKCKCCGAQLIKYQGKVRCEYCDTEYV